MADTAINITEEELFGRLPKKIGQVSLNYDYYPGKDIYSDGDIEDTILNIVKKSTSLEFQSIIEQTNSWPILYHLSSIRGNIVDFLPITKNDKVLEIGSGCGAITDTLSRKAKEVTCVDLSARRSQINAYRNQDRDNINIYVGNFNDIEPHLDTDYDYICLIGVFEYGSSYIPTKNPYEDFLNIILKHVKEGGRVIIAIENKFGLKYWAGCAEDHNGEYYSSLEGYPNGGSARTFTRTGLERIFKSCKVSNYSFYYPYPDYKLPHTIYSDKRLPNKGELTDNMRNLDRHRMLTFDESYVFDSIIEDKEFPLFSNSYLAVLGPNLDVKYSKFSNDRKLEYAIRTDILKNQVKKTALNKVGNDHIKNMESNYKLLTQRYAGCDLRINKCKYDSENNEAIFAFEKGRALEEIMDEALFNKNFDEFKRLFRKFYELISYNSGVNITDYDLIFANILVDGDTWTLIDYEWCEPKIVDPKEVAFRALYCYLLEDNRRNIYNMDELLDEIGVSTAMAEFFRENEIAFQKKVTGRHKSIGEIKATIGTYAIDSKKLMAKELKDILNKRIQVFYDNGYGFSEEASKYIPDVYVEDNHICTDIEFDGNVKCLRIDPADFKCLVKINELVLNGENVLYNKKFVKTNGKAVKSSTYAFKTDDPNIVFELNEVLIKGENVLHIDMEVVPASGEMIEDICNSIKKIF